MKKAFVIISVSLLYLILLVTMVLTAPITVFLRMTIGYDMLKGVEDSMLDTVYVVKKNLVGKK